MIKGFFRLFHTLRFIKPIQFQYQVYYKFKKYFITIHHYKKYSKHTIKKIKVKSAAILFSTTKEYLSENTFEFIGLKHTFIDGIDWNFKGHGKLWNYNLQYFTYLLDETIPSEERLQLLKKFSKNLLSSKVQLEPYPVSIRIVNSLLFHSRYPISDAIILEAILKQVDYLEHNLEYHILGNHLLENLFCLFLASIYLDDFQLQKKSYQLLIAQLNEQILDDGGHYECSVMYHSILLSKLLLCIEVYRNGSKSHSLDLDAFENTASQMLSWIKTYSFPDGSWALMNDAAEGIAPTTEKLVIAAEYLKITSQPILFSNSGFAKIYGENWEIIIKTGGVQPSYQPGHTHADIGNFCLWSKGKQIIVDRGISTYNSNHLRSEERSTHSHNTVTIGGLNQSDVWSSFRIGDRSKFKTKLGENFIEVSVSPYHDKNSIHKRIITKVGKFKFTITDSVSIPNSLIDLFATGSLQLSKNCSMRSFGYILEDKDIRITFTEPTQFTYESGIYSTHFNEYEQGTRLIYQVKDTVEMTIELL